MGRYVAFLRGMNLGGRRIKNEELRLRFEELGFVDVATFRASGNVIFSADRAKPEAVVARLEEGLEGVARLRGPGLSAQRRGGAGDRGARPV